MGLYKRYCRLFFEEFDYQKLYKDEVLKFHEAGYDVNEYVHDIISFQRDFPINGFGDISSLLDSYPDAFKPTKILNTIKHEKLLNNFKIPKAIIKTKTNYCKLFV